MCFALDVLKTSIIFSANKCNMIIGLSFDIFIIVGPDQSPTGTETHINTDLNNYKNSPLNHNSWT